MEFEQSQRKFWKKLKNHNILVLSTGSDNRVSSRRVSVIIKDKKLYFQTDKKFLKFKQLSKNPNAAFCFENYSVEGKCKCIGSPTDNKNSFFAEMLKKYFYLAYKNYTHLKSEQLLEFTPTLIYSWGYEIAKPFMEYWDLENKTYLKKYIQE